MSSRGSLQGTKEHTCCASCAEQHITPKVATHGPNNEHHTCYRVGNHMWLNTAPHVANRACQKWLHSCVAQLPSHLELLHAVCWQQHPALGHAPTARPLLLVGPVPQVGAAQVLNQVPAATQQARTVWCVLAADWCDLSTQLCRDARSLPLIISSTIYSQADRICKRAASAATQA